MHLPATRPGVYPDAEVDAGRAAAAGFTPEVTARLLNYVAALNLADAARQADSNAEIIMRAETAGDHARAQLQRDKGFPRQSFYRLADPASKQRYLRVVDVNAIAHPTGEGPPRSVEAFIEIATGLVYKPDGWKRPAKGPRYSLATDDAAAALVQAAGCPGYLYRNLYAT